jgi:beta-galactosidase
VEAHRETELTARGLRLGGAGGREVDLFAGEVHYWRMPRAAWAGCLAAVRQIGFEVVTTFVPWGVHETEAGALDWSGARDLGAFLDEVAAAGMLAVLRPGPHGELTMRGGGLPARVLRDPAMQALTARGTPAWCPAPAQMFPLPSPASRAFRAAATRWIAAAAEVIAPRLYPAGPVVALDLRAGVLETARLGAYDVDYHPDALAGWREDAGAEHGDPPRAWDAGDAARCAAWVRFKERAAARAAAWVCEAIDAAGLGRVARFASAGGRPDEIHLPSLAAAGGGAALAVHARDPAEVRRRALYLGASAWPLPIAAELPAGGPAWLPPRAPADQAAATAAVLAGGARGLCFSMAVERDRWHGAAVSSTGQVTPRGEEISALLRALRAAGWTGLRRRTAAALVVSRAETRFATASSLLDPLPPLLGALIRPGPGGAAELAADRGAALHRRWLDAVIAGFDRAGLPFAILDEDAPADAWRPHRLLVAPTLKRIDRALLAQLHAASAREVRVVIGPERPTRDELDRPLDADAASLPRRVGLLRPGSLEDAVGLARDLASLVSGWESTYRLPAGSPGQLSVFEDSDGEARIVAIGNGDAAPARVRVIAPRATCLCDLATGERLNEQDECVVVSVRAYSTRLLSVEPTETTRAPR